MKTESPSQPSKKYRVTSLQKALSILELMIDQGRDLSITEISRSLNLGKGTVHRILSTLKDRRFVQQDSNNKMYGFGVRTLEIGTAVRKEKLLRKIMVPFLRELHAICKETVNAAVWEYNEIRYIYRIESEEMLRISASAGIRFPGYCAATGKVLLSFFSNEDIHRIYGRDGTLKKYTDRSISTLNDLIREIEQVRINGVAIDNEEALLGVYCVAAPVLKAGGDCVAAISISAPKNRVTEQTAETLKMLVSKTAKQISRALTET